MARRRGEPESSAYQLTPTDWKARSTASPDCSARRWPYLPGTAQIHFSPKQPFFSTDNSAGPGLRQGWSDVGTVHQSVPAYSMSLVINQQCGRQVQHFEAIIQRRWPYVLSTPPIVSASKAFQMVPGWPTRPARLKAAFCSIRRRSPARTGSTPPWKTFPHPGGRQPLRQRHQHKHERLP